MGAGMQHECLSEWMREYVKAGMGVCMCVCVCACICKGLCGRMPVCSQNTRKKPGQPVDPGRKTGKVTESEQPAMCSHSKPSPNSERTGDTANLGTQRLTQESAAIMKLTQVQLQSRSLDVANSMTPAQVFARCSGEGKAIVL